MPEVAMSAASQVARPEAFLDEIDNTFQRAQDAVGHAVDRFYNIGGYRVRLRFAGPALLEGVTPALQHLAIPPTATPHLTVCIWDSVSTGTEMPPPPWTADDYLARGEIRGYNNERMYTAFHVGANTLNMLDRQQDRAFYWIRDARDLPYYESGSPLRTILHWWMGDHGRQYTHAAAIGTPEGGVLLAGKGGSGKSTTALSCLHSPLVYAGDDYCLLRLDADPYVYSLYNSAKLKPDNIERLPHLVPYISNAGRLGPEKALLFLQRHFPEKIVKGFAVRAILLPRVTGRPDTTLSPASAIAGLSALAPSTIFQLSGAGRKAFVEMSDFVRRLPCYYLELGTDLSQIPGVILSLLNGE